MEVIFAAEDDINKSDKLKNIKNNHTVGISLQLVYTNMLFNESIVNLAVCHMLPLYFF